MKFLFGEVFSFIIDTAGQIADIVVGGGSKNRLCTQTTITGGNGVHEADVILEDGERKLRSKADVTVNSLRGFDPIADTWFWIGTEQDTLGVGGAGDTVRVQIAAGDNPTLFPAVDVTTTVLAGDDETILGNRIVSNLNANANFVLNYFARRLDEDAVTVYITARYPGPAGARPNTNDFQVSATGTTTVTAAFDAINQKQKNTSLARDPANPTLGVLGISGSVTAGEGDVTGRIIEFAQRDLDDSEDLRVDGSVTPEEFHIHASATAERFFTSLRFEALGSGIQFSNFLSKNGKLTNGVIVTIRSNDSEVSFPAITATEDFASFFSRGPSDFDLYDVAGADYFRSTLTFAAPFQLFKIGTFATDDYIKVTINDDLSSGLTQFKFIGFGFERDF
jgi:hypothetical protein